MTSPLETLQQATCEHCGTIGQWQFERKEHVIYRVKGERDGGILLDSGDVALTENDTWECAHCGEPDWGIFRDIEITDYVG